MPINIQKRNIQQAFSRSARIYDQSAHLQKKTGRKLLVWVKKNNLTPKNILDLGCGTGFFIPSLENFFPKATIFPVDIAYGMLKKTKSLHPNPICSDADFLPFSKNSFELIFSNLMLQWSCDLEKTLLELERVLKKKGSLYFSTLGPKTLFELKESTEKTGRRSNVHQFLSRENIFGALKKSGFEIKTWERKIYIERFSSALALMQSLKKLGAHHPQHPRPQGLLTPEKLKEICHAYEPYQDAQQNFPATYEVYFLHAQVKK